MTHDIDGDIPALLPPDQISPIRNQHDLYQRWRTLMGPLGFSERLLWLNFVDRDGGMTPLLTQIADVPQLPDHELTDNLMGICGRLLCTDVPGGSVAILLSHPGRGPLSHSDRSWARALVAAAGRTSVTLQPVHVANDEALRVVSPDDLAAV